jgi:hypothetical protein
MGCADWSLRCVAERNNMLTRLNASRGSRYTLALGFLAILLAGLSLAILGMRAGPTPSPVSAEAPKVDFGQLPFQFESNAGQTSPEVKFLSHAPGGTFFFTSSGVVLSLSTESGQSNNDSDFRAPHITQPQQAKAVLAAMVDEPQDESQDEVVRLAFIGSNPDVSITGNTTLPGKVNYFIGADPEAWHSNLPAYGDVTYSGLYSGIDLSYGGKGGNLKGTYTVAPGADPNLIRWQYSGASNPQTSVSNEGMLQVHLGSSQPFTITEQAPVAWQELAGERMPVAVSYLVAADGSVGFALGAYDRTQPLTIDPTLTYSTYLGGNWAEYGFGIAADSAGNFYVVGMTNSTSFPTVNAYQGSNRGIDDVIVAKFNPAGQPIYITYLGGSHVDWGLDITVDADGNAYLTGFTASTNFPVANAYQPISGGGGYDAFVTKLNPTGSALVFSTYLGGSDTENSHGSGAQAGAIALDANRNVYVTGYTDSTNFPVLNAIQPSLVNIEDGFITKFNPAGSALIWSTYLGGVRNDQPKGIAVDPSGNVVIAGFTTSNNYPTANAYQSSLRGTYDAFVSKINAAGSALVYSTYLGGTDYEYVDEALDVAVDPQGNAYITGFTGSWDLPIAGAAFQPVYGGGVDGFISKFTPTGGLSYSTFLGGNWSDSATSIAVNSAGEAFVFGSTQSENFPTMNPLFPQLRGSEDAIVTHLNASGSGVIFSTYFGGTNNREMQAPGALTIDQNNNIYITGNTESSDFPTTANAFQPFRASVEDAFISRISENNPTPTPAATGNPSPTPPACIIGDYAITQSTGAALVQGTTFLPNSDCDNCTAPLVLPFPVQLYDQTFTQARIGSNGNIQFSGDNALPFNSSLPNNTYNNTIFAFWDDLFLDDEWGGLGVYTSVSGTAPNRILNVEWRASENSAEININFEVRLYEEALPGQGNGKFDVIYGTMERNGDSATVGVQRDTGSRFTQHSYNTGVISQGLKLTFTLPPCATPTPVVNSPTPTFTPAATPIPPTLLYSTYHGSFEGDSIEDLGKDAAGNIYVAGTTFQNDIYYGDIYVSKFSPNGQNLLYTTILGGASIDYAYALSVDAAGNATVAGIATSYDYPLLNPIRGSHAGGTYDVVMTKLNTTGQMIFSTYLGGSGSDYADGLATDEVGNVYLTGYTNSTNFPTTAGSYQTTNQGMYDGYVTKITPNGSAIVWSTYLGGRYGDESHDLALDSQGNIYLTGWTVSDNFPTLNPFQSTLHTGSSGDAFVTKMNPQGTGLIYSTYLGGNNPPGPGEDNGQGITVDGAGYAYVTGYTQSPNFPITPGSFQPFFKGNYDAFVTKLTPAGNALAYSTFVGGTYPPFGDDKAFDIAVDSSGQAHITGKTNSPDFPAVRAMQTQKADVYDAFVSKLNVTGSALVYSTFLGGDWSPPWATGEDAGSAVLIDQAGNAVIGGTTVSYDFPIANPFQYDSGGKSDGFITKISGSNPGPTSTPTATAPATTATVVMPTNTPIPGATNTPLPNATNTPLAQASSTPIVCTVTFSDVQPGSTFYVFVQCLACRGIIGGYDDGTFRPDDGVTRGQLSKIVSNAAGFDDDVSGQTFSDVDPNNTFYLYIERMVMKGVIGGYEDGTFRPGNPATRGQITKIVSNARGYNDIPTTQTFEDVAPDSIFYMYVERLASRGVMSGNPCGGEGEPCGLDNRPYFRPFNNATRGQTAKVGSNTFFPTCNP